LLLQWGKLVTINVFYNHPASDKSNVDNDLYDIYIEYVVFSFKSIRRSLDSPKGPLSLPESDVTCHGAVYFLMSYRVGVAVEKVGQVRGSGLTNVEVAPQCNLFYGRLGNCYDGRLGCTWAVENK
jgi:hypothetical protein